MSSTLAIVGPVDQMIPPPPLLLLLLLLSLRMLTAIHATHLIPPSCIVAEGVLTLSNFATHESLHSRLGLPTECRECATGQIYLSPSSLLGSGSSLFCVLVISLVAKAVGCLSHHWQGGHHVGWRASWGRHPKMDYEMGHCCV